MFSIDEGGKKKRKSNERIIFFAYEYFFVKDTKQTMYFSCVFLCFHLAKFVATNRACVIMHMNIKLLYVNAYKRKRVNAYKS